MAEVEGFRFEESLTGFKWIGNTAMLLEKQRLNVIFSYEEAIGFTIGDIVKDKDGVSALAFFSEWAVQLYKRGITAYDYLEELYKKYGYFVSENSYFICDDKKKIAKIFDRIRFGEESQREGGKVSRAIGLMISSALNLQIGRPDTSCAIQKQLVATRSLAFAI